MVNTFSPRPLDDAELAHHETAIELLNRLYNFFEISKVADPVRTPSWERWQKHVTDILGIYTALHDALARKEGEIERLMGQLNSEVEFDEEGFHNMAQAIRDLEEENQELRIQLRNSGGF